MLHQNHFWTGKNTQWGEKNHRVTFPSGKMQGCSAQEREEPDTQAKCLNRFFLWLYLCEVFFTPLSYT